MTFEVQRDFASLPEFRKLVSLLEPKGLSNFLGHHVFLRLYMELSHYIGIEPLACMPRPSGLDIFYDFCQIGHLCPKATFTNAVLGSGLLVEQGNFYYCKRFFAANERISMDELAGQLRISERSSLLHRTAKFNKSAAGLARVIPLEWRVVDGIRVPDAVFNRTLVIIRMIDSIVYRPLRPAKDFSQGLVEDACRIAQRFDPRKMDMIFDRLMLRRKSNDFPRSTELIVANFDEVLVRIEPQYGWVQWERILRSKPKNEIDEIQKNEVSSPPETSMGASLLPAEGT